MMHGGYGMFGAGRILALIIIVIVIYFIMKYFNENNNNSNTVSQNNKAIQILRERYASGEISEEEYTSKLTKLNKE